MTELAQTAAEPGTRPSGGSLFGAAAGILLLLAVVAALAGQAAQPAVRPEDVLAGRLAIDELPFGLAPVAALRNEGVLIATFASPAAEEELPRLEPAKSKGGPKSKGEKQKSESFDWSAVPVGEAGRAPIELLVARHGRGGIERVEELFEPPSRERGESAEIESFDASGGRATMDRGRVRWGDYEVAFVHERHLERGGTFRDVVRCNLSLPGRPLVAYARWPRGFPASLERLEELLAALRPVAAD